MQWADYERFAQALCDPDLEPPPGLRVPDGAALAERFAVYRNTVHVGLVEALAAGFPVVQAQVGEDFFRAMARAYVQQHKPSTPLLALYGEHFPAFIATFDPAAAMPWLPDLARLERAWSECWCAAEAPALPVTALHGMDPEEIAVATLRAHPAARLVRSRWPVADLWEAHQRDAQPDLSALQWQPQSVLLTRPQAEIRLRRVDEAAARFTSALLGQQPIEIAAQQSPEVDAGALLGQLLELGLFTGIRR
ncbi:MAG TPA: DNA-binding domain-containing protein [Steroidobacteraceae bacterium]|nr:DNA-binding domain-containing protein [Steroidobacteraceae bacterium]